jgi:hypothetical protein
MHINVFDVLYRVLRKLVLRLTRIYDCLRKPQKLSDNARMTAVNWHEASDRPERVNIDSFAKAFIDRRQALWTQQ